MRLLIFFIISIQFTLIFGQQVKYDKSVPSLMQETNIGRLTDFAIDERSNHFLLDSEKKKIWIYNGESVLTGEIPKTLSAPLFENPLAINVSSENQILVLDNELKKIIILDEKGSKASEFGNDRSTAGSFDNPVGMTLNAHDNIYVIDNSLQQIIKFNFDGLFLGFESVVNPISITADIENNVYVLAQNEDDDSYRIISFPYDLRSREVIRISNVIDPVDISVNQFGEFYVVDREYRKVFHYGPAGNLIGEQIGIKSSSAGPGKFADAAAVNNTFVNNEIDKLFVLDREFNYVQSFSVESRHERKKLYTKPRELDIRLENSITNESFEKFYAADDLYFYVQADNTVKAVKNGKNLFIIRHGDLGDVTGIATASDNIYVADGDAGEIYVFSSSDGSFKFVFGQSVEISGYFPG